MKWLIFILLVLAVPLLLRLAVMQFGPQEPARSGIDSNGLLYNCPETPNCYTVTVDIKASDEVGAKSADYSRLEILKQIGTAIEAENGKVVTNTNTYLQATFQSKLMAFIDDFECLVVVAEGKQSVNNNSENSGRDSVAQVQLHCRSASRIGRSDLGANKKRVNAVLARAGIQAA